MQYNSAGALAGSANFTFDGTNSILGGTSTAGAFIPSSSTVPTNGVFLPAANTLAWGTNSSERMRLKLGLGVGTTTDPGAGNVLASKFGTTGSAFAYAADFAGSARSYGLLSTQLATPGTPTATPSGSGGTLGPATYYFKIVAVDGLDNTTAAGAENAGATIAGSTGSVAVSWTAVVGAASYRIYYSTSAGTEANYFTSTTNSFTMTTTTGNTAGAFPTVNTTGFSGFGTTTPKSQLHVKGASGVTSFIGLTQLGALIDGATSTNDYSGLDFTSNGGSPVARIAAIAKSTGSLLQFGTSNNYVNGITNTALSIDASGNLILGNGDANAAPSSPLFRATDGSGTDIAGGNVSIQGGRGTGAGAGGYIRFLTAAAGSTGSGLNTATEKMRLLQGGQIGHGGIGNAAVNFYEQSNITGGAGATSIYSNTTVQSDVTTLAISFSSALSTAAASFTCGTMVHFKSSQGTVGTGSTVNSQYGFDSDGTLIGATNNFAFRAEDTAAVTTGKTAYGFYSAVNIATGGGTTYGFYAAGTAPNYFGGDMRFAKTVTAAGTTGAQTINKNAGTVNFAAAATSLVVTNSLVTTSSIIIATVGTNDATMKSVLARAAAGSFTIYGNAAATAETRVNFIVIN